jgi:hypothetical protein
MKIEDIKTLTNRKPFRPFIIKLENGDAVPVTSDTELLFPKKRPDTVYVFAVNSSWIFDVEAVTALQEVNLYPPGEEN